MPVKPKSTLYYIRSLYNGMWYKRYAWTGGDVPHDNDTRSQEFNGLYMAFLEDQYKDYGQPLYNISRDVREIFANRALLDAWRTMHPR